MTSICYNLEKRTTCDSWRTDEDQPMEENPPNEPSQPPSVYSGGSPTETITIGTCDDISVLPDPNSPYNPCAYEFDPVEPRPLTILESFVTGLDPEQLTFWSDLSNREYITYLASVLLEPPYTTDKENLAKWGIDYLRTNPQKINPDIFYELFIGPNPVTSITDSLQNYPCVQVLAQQVAGINGSLTNSITEIIKNTFGKSTRFHVTYVPANLNFSDNNPVAGRTGVGEWLWTLSPTTNNWESPIKYLALKVKLDTAFMRMASKIAIAQILLHESLHAYFHYRQVIAYGTASLTDSLQKELGFLMPYGPSTNNTSYANAQHEQMANKYVTQLAVALKEMFPLTVDDLHPAIQGYFYSPDGLSIDDYYKAIAWTGLQTKAGDATIFLNGWKAFLESNPNLANKYLFIQNKEMFGVDNSVPTCN